MTMTTATRLLAFAAVLAFCAVAAGQTTETTSGSFQNVNASFSNTYAGDGSNEVQQTVQLYIPEPDETFVAPEWVRDVIPQMVDPDMPICTLADRMIYPIKSATATPLRNTELSEIAIYVLPSSDIRPVLTIEHSSVDGSAGYVELTGPGIYGNVKVTADTPDRRLCGNWAWSSFGYYKFEVKVKNAIAKLEYYTRPHTPGRDATFEEFPLTFTLNVHTTVAGNGVNVLTDTALHSKHLDGKITVRLDNQIVGNSNSISQTARARLDTYQGESGPAK